MWERFVGEVPDGHNIDHVKARGCVWRDCVNLAHLDCVPIAVNNLRSDSRSALNARKDACDWGHEFDLINTRWKPDGRRECIACDPRRAELRRAADAERQPSAARRLVRAKLRQMSVTRGTRCSTSVGRRDVFSQEPRPEMVERCTRGLLPGEDCAHKHVAAALDKGLGGYASLRLCPGHGGREATLSINPANLYRVFWNEQATGCDLSDLDIHSLLLARGVHESCLGTYGLRKQGGLKSPPRIQAAYDDAMAADANRWYAMAKIPPDTNGRLLVMCRQAIAEGDGYLPGDLFGLLPRTKREFIDLAARAGIQRGYRWALWDRWEVMLRSEAA